jgi:ArsR family transcriptional regulator, lead/cadmium/zinc/bismuth-responsive transcriptional repressor
MHLVSAEHAHRQGVDDHRACEAVEALGAPGNVETWAARFSTLADPNRLAMLVCIRHAGPISVTDLALATGMNDAAVSQALRLLRASGAVSGTRDGRIIRYRLTDESLDTLLAFVGPPWKTETAEAPLS